MVSFSGFSNHREDGVEDKILEFPPQNSYRTEVLRDECNVSEKTTLVLNLSLLRVDR